MNPRPHFKIGFDLKRCFFDGEAVTKRLTAARRKALSKAGAFVRQRARHSIRPGAGNRRMRLDEMDSTQKRTYFGDLADWKRVGKPAGRKPRRPLKGIDRTSKPGEAPRSHVGHLRNHIYFAYDSTADDVVSGPASISAKGRAVPRALEHGGDSLNAYGEAVNIDARPYMRPALEKEKDNFAALLLDSL